MGKKPIVFGAVFLLVVGASYTVFKLEARPKPEPVERGGVFTSSEYGFSIAVPEGWTYKTPSERVGEATLVVRLARADKKVSIPIFIEERSWDEAVSDVVKNFKPETIERTTLAGQPAVKIVAEEKETNPGYSFRIKHPRREDTVLLGTAVYVRGKDLEAFHNLVETVLNSIEFD